MPNRATHMPAPEVLRTLLSYDPHCGSLMWLPRPPSMFTKAKASKRQPTLERARQWAAQRWNAQYAFTPAFTSTTTSGYHQGSILGRVYKRAAVVWAIHYGVLPQNEIDHVDGDRTNDRIENLRDVSREQQMRNRGVNSNSAVGVTGVNWHMGKWRAYIRAAGVNVALGRFENIEDAIAARKAAETKAGYHPNPGKRSAIVHDPEARTCKCAACRKERAAAPPPVGRKWMKHDPVAPRCMCRECKTARRTRNPVTGHKGTCGCAACAKGERA